MAPKRVFTRSHLDLEPATSIGNLEKILRKKSIAEGSRSHSPLHRSPSLPEKLVSLQDLEFDISFEQILFRKKFNSFVSETILDQTILQSRTPEILSPREDVDQIFLQKFDKLEDPVENLDQALDKAYFQ